MRKPQNDPLQREGGQGGKLSCNKMLLSCKTAKIMLLDNVLLFIQQVSVSKTRYWS